MRMAFLGLRFLGRQLGAGGYCDIGRPMPYMHKQASATHLAATVILKGEHCCLFPALVLKGQLHPSTTVLNTSTHMAKGRDSITLHDWRVTSTHPQ